MEKIKLLKDEEKELKVYDVSIYDDALGCINLSLTRPEFCSMNIDFFIELGFSVTIRKILM